MAEAKQREAEASGLINDDQVELDELPPSYSEEPTVGYNVLV